MKCDIISHEFLYYFLGVHISIQLKSINSTALMIQWKRPNTTIFVRGYTVKLSYEEEIFDQLFHITRTTEVLKTNLIWSLKFNPNISYNVCVRADYILSNRLSESCNDWVMPPITACSSTTTCNSKERSLVSVIIVLAILTTMLMVFLVLAFVYPSCITPKMKNIKYLSR